MDDSQHRTKHRPGPNSLNPPHSDSQIATMHYTCAAILLLASSPCVRGFLTPIPPHIAVGQCTLAVSPSTAGLPNGRQASATRLYVGGKIFGQEDEPAPPPEAKPVIKGAEKDEDEEDEEGEDGGEEDDSGGDGAEQKPKRRKRRKKYDFSESSWMARAEEEKRLAQELARKFPDIGQVRVDRMGNIIGGVNPFEDTDVKLEDQPHPEDLEDFPEMAGEISGMDDPADAPWRIEAERIVREQVEVCGLTCDDILWTFHKLEVTVTRGENDGPIAEAAYVDSDKLMQAIKGINSALEEREEELFVLGRHELIVATPGAKDILTTDKEFKAFKGFEVIVKTGGPFKNKRELRGKLLERTFDELMITQSGRKVRIPLALVDEVRLPPALVEAGDLGY